MTDTTNTEPQVPENPIFGHRWALVESAAIRAYGDARAAHAVAQMQGEPVAWLKIWDSVGGARKWMRRVDFTPECEPWLANMCPEIVPLYLAPATAERPQAREVASTEPLHRTIKNSLVIDGTIDAAFNAALREREPDALRCILVELAHKSVDAALAQTKPSTEYLLSEHNRMHDEIVALRKAREVTDAEIDELIFAELGHGPVVDTHRIVRAAIALANGRGET